MRIAHITTDEVNQALAVQAARPLGATMTALDPDGYSVEFAQGGRGKKPS